MYLISIFVHFYHEMHIVCNRFQTYYCSNTHIRSLSPILSQAGAMKVRCYWAYAKSGLNLPQEKSPNIMNLNIYIGYRLVSCQPPLLREGKKNHIPNVNKYFEMQNMPQDFISLSKVNTPSKGGKSPWKFFLYTFSDFFFFFHFRGRVLSQVPVVFGSFALHKKNSYIFMTVDRMISFSLPMLSLLYPYIL